MAPDDVDEQTLREARERSRAMTAAEYEEQARNFAAGNAGIEDPRVTRAMIDRAAELLRR